MDDKLKKRIELRKDEGSFRQLTLKKGSIDFFSNDYLGLAKEKPSHSQISEGSSGSRLLSGNSIQAMDCEERLSSFYDSEEAIVYNSGYDANVGFISAVAQRSDYILYDEHIHASIRDGIRLSFAKAYSFQHNDLRDLERQLEKMNGTIYVMAESIYSMDGDMAPLGGMQALVKKFGAYLIIDEAHAVGIYGDSGRGIVHARGMQKDVFARTITFGKAYGYHGAAILCAQALKEYLVNFSRSFIYSTALPVDSYTKIIDRVELDLVKERQKMLHDNIYHFRNGLKSFDFLSEENSPIQVLQFENRDKLMVLVEKILKSGIYTKPILPPTVPKGSFRLRLCIHSFNSKNEIDLLRNCLSI